MLSRDQVRRVVLEAIQSILPACPPEAITGDKHLSDLGADSVDRVEIVLVLISRLQIDTPMSVFSDIPHIDALVDFLHQRTQEWTRGPTAGPTSASKR